MWFMPQTHSKETVNELQTDVGESYWNSTEQGGRRENLQQIKDPRSASSYEIITESATSNKQSTTSNLEVVTDVVTQIMWQRTANLEKLSATSVEK